MTMNKMVVIGLLLTGPLCARAQLLYKCTSPRGDTVTYLMGTSHVLPMDRYHHDPVIDSLVKQSSVLFTEHYVPAADPVYRKHRKKMIGVREYANNKRLDDLLPPEEVAFIYHYYETVHGRSRQAIIAASRTIAPFFHQELVSKKGGKLFYLDLHIYQQAVTQQHKIVYLDDALALLAGYKALADVYTPQWLLQKIRSGDFDKQQEDPMDSAYLHQDTSAIKRHMANNPDRQSPRYDDVIKNRNTQWEAKIEQQGAAINFVACGMAHVVEDDIGLIYYFRRRGYRVEGIVLKTMQ